ncbi:hypothetical protein H6P81_017603 [Aristolochia fimbriata]|uniref:Uncharacterized protein n=1 Tax=Aristolochia fimbriata TaxID=158543 RepID=A0AAV7DZP2_ARIFI|nr:hypothetical protein H6P81_017603 [Aristolochia fimbriata]
MTELVSALIAFGRLHARHLVNGSIDSTFTQSPTAKKSLNCIIERRISRSKQTKTQREPRRSTSIPKEERYGANVRGTGRKGEKQLEIIGMRGIGKSKSEKAHKNAFFLPSNENTIYRFLHSENLQRCIAPLSVYPSSSTSKLSPVPCMKIR